MSTGLNSLDVASLRLVRAIGQEGTITAAAVSLGYSQPAVSQHLRRLERRLGTALVDRSSRGVRLTEAGQVLARHAVTVAGALDAAAREVNALAGLQSGRVRLVAFPSSSATVVPAALALLHRRAPHVDVSFTEAEPPQSLDLLRSGGCDIALAFDYPGAELGRSRRDLTGLVTRPLLEDPSVLALARTDDRAHRRTLHLRDLSQARWIAGCPRCRGHLVAACAAAGFAPDVVYETDDYVAALGFVAAGLGIALLPGLVLPVASRQPAVTVRPVEGVASRGVYAVTTPDLLRVPVIAATLDALVEAAATY